MATAATTKNNFITWSSTTNTLTVDASSSNAKAGFRAVFFYACNKIFTAQCAYVAQYIVIYPASFTAATTTTQTRTVACSPKTEWPKVIGDTTA